MWWNTTSLRGQYQICYVVTGHDIPVVTTETYWHNYKCAICYRLVTTRPWSFFSQQQKHKRNRKVLNLLLLCCGFSPGEIFKLFVPLRKVTIQWLKRSTQESGRRWSYLSLPVTIPTLTYKKLRKTTISVTTVSNHHETQTGYLPNTSLQM